MTETLAHEYSSESIQRELSNEYQHDRVWMVLKNLSIFVLWTKVASALEGLTKNNGEDFFVMQCLHIISFKVLEKIYLKFLKEWLFRNRCWLSFDKTDLNTSTL